MKEQEKESKYCRNCVYPRTKPHLFFNEKGVCSACEAGEKKDQNIDWKTRTEELKEILDKYRSKDGSWDCIVPVSGGKDSTYQVYMMKKLGMHPLAITFAQCSITETGQHNMDNIAEMGVDHIIFRPNRQIYRKIFSKSFEKLGDPCWPCHVGIVTVPAQFAVKLNIPLIIWGENPELEYGGPASATESRALDRAWLEEFGGLLGMRTEDWEDEGISLEELNPYIYPSDEDINRVGVTGLYLGYYTKWDARNHVELVKKHGFIESPERIEGTYLSYENLDGKFVRIHDYLMWLKHGFGRTSSMAGIDIRNKRLSRKEAIELVKKYDGEKPRKYFDEFCEFVNKTSEEVGKIFDSFTNKAIFKTDENGNLIKDSEGNPVLKDEIE